MSKLYVFAIGGTGSRVLKSLTMFLAAGVDCDYDIVPIIIDPDVSNANLSDTIQLMDEYRCIRSQLSFGNTHKNKFFKTFIDDQLNGYRIALTHTNSNLYKLFISYSSMSRENRALTQMLFSEKNLSSTMDEGFKGNPNIGSVVLNQIVETSEFKQFSNTFSANDKIFIISSIFGGTGASGFPLLLKTFRTNDKIPNHNLINQAEIGAITILPYFNVQQDPKSQIDSSTFISKTKSALSYYEKSIGNQINSLYYIADEMKAIYDNHEGGRQQNNNANLIEFLAATSIMHFAQKSTKGLNRYWELGIKDLNNTGEITFFDFYDWLKENMQIPLTELILFTHYLKDHFSSFTSLQNANTYNVEDIESTSFFKNIKSFTVAYSKWLKEMETNKRSFRPFNLDCGGKPFNIVNGITKPKKIKSFKTFAKSNYDLFDIRINDSITDKGFSEEQKFLDIFYQAIETLVEDKHLF